MALTSAQKRDFVQRFIDGAQAFDALRFGRGRIWLEGQFYADPAGWSGRDQPGQEIRRRGAQFPVRPRLCPWQSVADWALWRRSVSLVQGSGEISVRYHEISHP